MKNRSYTTHAIGDIRKYICEGDPIDILRFLFLYNTYVEFGATISGVSFYKYWIPTGIVKLSLITVDDVDIEWIAYRKKTNWKQFKC